MSMGGADAKKLQLKLHSCGHHATERGSPAILCHSEAMQPGSFSWCTADAANTLLSAR